MARPAVRPVPETGWTERSRARGSAPRARRRGSWWIGCAAYLAYLALRVLRATTRPVFAAGVDLPGRLGRGERVIIAFWHDRLIGIALAFSAGRLCVLNSRHRDGEIITRCVRRLGIGAARGSSTRGWASGLRGLLAAYRAGASLVIAPDGPRGPRHAAKTGAVQLARATGAEIVPVTFVASRCWRARSWDRLIVPRPFARIVYVQGGGLRVARDASPAEVETARAALEAELERIEEVARAWER